MRTQYYQFSEPVALFKEIDSALTSLLGASPVSFSRGTKSAGANSSTHHGETRYAFTPALNMWESDEEFRLELEIPGVEPSHVEVMIEGNVLTVKGERARSEQGQSKPDSDSGTTSNGTWRHSERRFGAFMRELELPETVDTDSIRADQKNGVLTITLAKQQRATPRKVPVNAVS